MTEVKGEALPEKTLYVRLYLLEVGWRCRIRTRVLTPLPVWQGVVAYHRGETVSAASYLRQGEDALSLLVVTDEDLAPLLGMGFTLQVLQQGPRACVRAWLVTRCRLKESRRALRVSGKNQDLAVESVMKRREELRLQQEQARSVRRQRRLGKVLCFGSVSVWVFLKCCCAVRQRCVR